MKNILNYISQRFGQKDISQYPELFHRSICDLVYPWLFNLHQYLKFWHEPEPSISGLSQNLVKNQWSSDTHQRYSAEQPYSNTYPTTG
jgi:hypothetical protein